MLPLTLDGRGHMRKLGGCLGWPLPFPLLLLLLLLLLPPPPPSLFPDLLAAAAPWFQGGWSK